MSWLWTLLIGRRDAAAAASSPSRSRRRAWCCPTTSSSSACCGTSWPRSIARLLPFLTHDRVTLAGAMASIGVLYTGLSWFGVAARTPLGPGRDPGVVGGRLRQLLPVPRLRLLRSVPRLRHRDPLPAAAVRRCTAGSAAPTRTAARRCGSRIALAARPVGPARARDPGRRLHRRRLVHLGDRRDPRVRARGSRVPADHRAGAGGGEAAPGAAGRARSCHARRDAARQRPGHPADRPVGLPARRALALVDAARSPACPATPPRSASTMRSATTARFISPRRTAGSRSSPRRWPSPIHRSAGAADVTPSGAPSCRPTSGRPCRRGCSAASCSG